MIAAPRVGLENKSAPAKCFFSSSSLLFKIETSNKKKKGGVDLGGI